MRAKPLVQALFWSSCLLSVVSFYTTQQGMALYLSTWFSWLAALGVQISLVMVAWLIGIAEQRRQSRRALLIGVYAITAVTSVAFSYVSLNTWFGQRERPATMQRALYDELQSAGARAEQLLAAAAANGRRYTLALEEMAAAEKTHGHISKAPDADAFLDAIRAAVAREGEAFRQGSGEGVRYTAFDRHARLTAQAVAGLDRSLAEVRQARNDLKPSMPVEEQLRRFRHAYDTVPWPGVEQLLQRAGVERPALPGFARYAEQSGSSQEDLMRSFEELFTAPSSRNVFSFALAAFIDVIVFLLAFATAPYLHGEPEQKWLAAGAVLDANDPQVFARGLLRKMRPGRKGMPRVEVADLTPGERQLCLLLVGKAQAVSVEEGDGPSPSSYFLIDAQMHQRMVESIAEPGMGLRVAAES